jgi:two-component system, cell cycle response regulator
MAYLKTKIRLVDTGSMRSLRAVSARGHGVRGLPRSLPVRPIATLLLALLSVWAVGYELACTAVPALLKTPPFEGLGPDVAFFIAGLLLIARSFSAEGGWALIGLGALCWAGGDVYWQLNLSNLSSPPVPSWADAGYLSFCPLAFVGILWLVRKRVATAPKTLIADALAAALAVAAISAAVVVQPVLTHAQGGTLALATNLAYPVVDLLLLGLIVGATALGRWRLQRTWVLLGLSVISFWVADSLYLVTVATNTYQASAWFNPLWYVSPILAACAAWLPRERSPRAFRREGIRGIVMPLIFACAALATLVWSSFSPVGAIAVVLATLSVLVIMVRLVLTWRENASLLRASQDEALTDDLTGLLNRRALAVELEYRMAASETGEPYMLALFDLDGFKYYNDNFGHPTGDALLRRLGARLADCLRGSGAAYRMGGDEFCALIDDSGESESIVEAAAVALTEHGEGFVIGCSYGSVVIPDEARTSEVALRLADQRMYAQKRGDRSSASRQSADVLLRALAERSPDLGTHLRDVAELAGAVAQRFTLPIEEVENIRQAAELHDVGKVAIPDAILDNPGTLSADEWAFIHRHTVIGERIIGAAPALRRTAALVRASHENIDGTGYPDGLAGDQIPLGSRIISVCDAFNAMTTNRPYRGAMDEASAIAELRRCTGSQFDRAVVEHLCAILTRPRAALRAA